mgnify:FL=1
MNPNNKNKNIFKKYIKKPRIIIEKKPVELIEEKKQTEKPQKPKIQKKKKLILIPKTETKVSKTLSVKQEKEKENPQEKSESKPLEEISSKIKYNPDINKDFENLPNISKNERIYLCIYRINNNGLKPFLEYCLLKYPESENKAVSDLCVFPYLKYSREKSVLEEANQFINKLTNDNYEPKGFLNFKNDLFLFYEIKNSEFNVDELKRENQLWWTLIDEIINLKKLINFPIHKHVINFFLNNKSLLYLLNNKNEIIETPSVGFHGTYYGLVPFIKNFGLRKSTLNAMVGPYYYFGTFRKSVRYAGWTSTYKPREIDGKTIANEEGLYEKGGIIRFAIFLGNMKALLNHPNDKDDFSELVEQRIRDNPRSKRYELNTLKLHDHNGKWVENYDSIYIGRALLANGKRFMANPEFIVKTYEQQVPLTYHYLDKSTLLRNWDNNYDYYFIE